MNTRRIAPIHEESGYHRLVAVGAERDRLLIFAFVWTRISLVEVRYRLDRQ